MKPRDRVITALNRNIPDRVPFQATFSPEFAERLREYYGIKSDTPHDPHSSRWNGYELEKLMGQDALQVGIGWFTNYYLDSEDYIDEWGIHWTTDPYTTKYGTGLYTNIADGPLYDSSKISDYKAPDPHESRLYQTLERLINEEQSDYYVIGRVHTTIYETAWALRGMDNLLCDMALDPDLANSVLDIPFNYHLGVVKEIAKRGADMIWLGDDMGAQDSMIISPDMWREYFKPRMATIIAEAKKIKPDICMAYHTDGYNTPIIPDLTNRLMTSCLCRPMLISKLQTKTAHHTKFFPTRGVLPKILYIRSITVKKLQKEPA